MSIWTETQVHCPECSHAFLARTLEAANAARLVHLREAIIARELNRATCPRCLTEIVIERPMIYSDLERGEWIAVRRADELASWREHELAVRDSFRRHGREGAPPAIRTLCRQVRVRVVFGYDDLRDKVLAWTAGLDDAMVECAKLWALRDRIILANPLQRVLLDEVENDELVLRSGQYTARIARAAVLRLDRVDLSARYPALFEEGFVSVTRLLAE